MVILVAMSVSGGTTDTTANNAAIPPEAHEEVDEPFEIMPALEEFDGPYEVISPEESAIAVRAEIAWDAAYDIVRYAETSLDSTDSVSRWDIIYFFVGLVVEEYKEDYDFYIPELLSVASMDINNFVDVMKLVLTDEQVAAAHWMWSNAWLYYFLEEIAYMLYTVEEYAAASFLQEAHSAVLEQS